MSQKQPLIEFAEKFTQQFIELFTNSMVYAQLAIILLAILTAFSLALFLKRQSPLLRTAPQPGPLFSFRRSIFETRDLLFPILNNLLLTISIEISEYINDESWLIRIAVSVAVILLIYSIISRYIQTGLIKSLVKWIAIPIVILQVFGWLDMVISYLDTIDFSLGNIRISLYSIGRVLLFGCILIWLARLAKNTGQKIIRRQTDLHVGTREVLAKLFEVTVYVIIFLVLLQVMGINPTTLTVFGGALGVGIGLGLQSIASNFISGIIILLDRSISIGDFIELEEGVTGIVREMNMRCTVVETFDGKDIVVPNEKFINGNVINWTHKDDKQRYSLNFQVAYDTDLNKLFELVREVCKSHPKVLSGENYSFEEQPDAEIQSFDDFGITILVEFWMRGIDDGKNRVGADLLHMIWDILRENDIQIPFPQREVRLLNGDLIFNKKAHESQP